MSLVDSSIAAFALAAGIALAGTPVAASVARRLSLLDRPSTTKQHAAPTPLLGGAALMLAFVVAILVCGDDLGRAAPLAAAVAVMCAVGTVDDRTPLPPSGRLAVAGSLAAGLWAFDIGWDLAAPGVVELAVSVLWTLVVVAAVSIYDNMDGQAGTIGAAAGLGLLFLDDDFVQACGAALAGACVGFLVHNLLLRPARIFLGDGGSWALGLLLAAIPMAAAGGAGGGTLAAAALLVAVPLFDAVFVVVARRRRGVSALTGGVDHVAHRVRSRLGSTRATAAALGALQLTLAAIAVAVWPAG